MNKFIVMSSSARFTDFWIDARIQIIKNGDIPYSIYSDWRNRADYKELKFLLDKSYQDVIRLYADELLVGNFEGYIGESTQAEMEVARQKGIPIKYFYPIGVENDKA